MRSLLNGARNVPYCQIKKDYDDVVSPIFGPPGIQSDVTLMHFRIRALGLEIDLMGHPVHL